MFRDFHALLADVYSLDLVYDIEDFVITDPRIANLLDGEGRSVEEKLLIAEAHGQAEVSLYLAASLVERLAARDPRERLDESNLADFWTALEGVSHFAYYAWKASVEKPVSLLEMELQAEVDKFIAANLLLNRQGERPSAELHRWLFELPRFDPQLGGDELHRYRYANRYAGKYCLRLGPELAQGLRDQELIQELRRFYRLSQPNKIRHIESM